MPPRKHANRHWIDGEAAAIEFVVEVRSRREACRSDIAYHLAALHCHTGRHCEPAHVPVAGADPAAVV